MALFGRKKQVEPEAVVEDVATLPQPPHVNESGLRSADDHRDYLVSLVEPLHPFGMQLLDALGLALCEEITAALPVPRHAVSDASGIAVRAADVAGASHDDAVQLTVVTVARGRELGEGQAQVVAEQARLPEGADAVLPWPFTDRGERTIKVFEPVVEGENLRVAGSDIAEDQVLASSGQVLDARTVGVLAAVGVDKVLARPRPRVVVVSQGVDLVEPGRPLAGDDQVHDATGLLIAAAARAAGCQVWRVSCTTGNADDLRETLSDQLIRADLIIVTGGIADADNALVREVLPTLGLCDFADVAMRPGQRQGFALVGDDDVPVVVLPTNPVAAHASFHAFVRPVIRRLAGTDQVENHRVRAFTSSVVRSPAGLTSVLRAVVRDEGGRQRVDILPHGTADQLSSILGANALAVIDPDVEVVSAGGALVCWLLDRD